MIVQLLIVWDESQLDQLGLSKYYWNWFLCKVVNIGFHITNNLLLIGWIVYLSITHQFVKKWKFEIRL